MSKQTHEVILVETEPPFLYITQLPESRLIRIELDGNYNMTGKVKVWTIGPKLEDLVISGRRYKEGEALCELHNLSKSSLFKTTDGASQLWLSLQTPNMLLLVDPYDPFRQGLPESVVPLP